MEIVGPISLKKLAALCSSLSGSQDGRGVFTGVTGMPLHRNDEAKAHTHAPSMETLTRLLGTPQSQEQARNC